MAQYKDYTVIYENNRGNRVVLTEHPYYINIEPLLDYSWAYTTRDRRRGSRIAGFNKGVASANLTIHVLAETVAERNSAIDALNNAIETDIYDGKPGKIWFNDWFTYGYIISAKNSKWQYGVGAVRKEVSFVREEETWFHVIKRSSYYYNDESESGYEYISGLKDYELDEDTGLEGYDYLFDYGEDKISAVSIVNPNPLGCNFIIDISGPVNNPNLRIGDTYIIVNVEVPDGAFLRIDSTDKTIILHYADNTALNAFGARDPDYYIFKLIDSGENAIIWDGSFVWDLQMIEERSEPRWLME